MRYKDMSDFEINKLVAKNVFNDHEWVCVSSRSDGEFVASLVNYTQEKFDPCNSSSDAWPIIVENNISMLADSDYALDRHLRKFKLNFTGRYVASAFPVMSDGFNGDEVQSIDKNPLRAAMICFLKMKDAESE